MCSFTSRRCLSASLTPLNTEHFCRKTNFVENLIIIVKMVVSWKTTNYKNTDCFGCQLLCIHCIRAQKYTFLPQCMTGVHLFIQNIPCTSFQWNTSYFLFCLLSVYYSFSFVPCSSAKWCSSQSILSLSVGSYLLFSQVLSFKR